MQFIACLVDTQTAQRQDVAAMCDQGFDFLGHLCQTQVPVVPESPGVYSQVTRCRVFAN